MMLALRLLTAVIAALFVAIGLIAGAQGSGAGLVAVPSAFVVYFVIRDMIVDA